MVNRLSATSVACGPNLPLCHPNSLQTSSTDLAMSPVADAYHFKTPTGDNGYAAQLQEWANCNSVMLDWNHETTRDAAGNAINLMIPIRESPLMPGPPRQDLTLKVCCSSSEWSRIASVQGERHQEEHCKEQGCGESCTFWSTVSGDHGGVHSRCMLC